MPLSTPAVIGVFGDWTAIKSLHASCSSSLRRQWMSRTLSCALNRSHQCKADSQICVDLLRR